MRERIRVLRASTWTERILREICRRALRGQGPRGHVRGASVDADEELPLQPRNELDLMNCWLGPCKTKKQPLAKYQKAEESLLQVPPPQLLRAEDDL